MVHCVTLQDDITLAIGNNLISEKLSARVIQHIIHNRGDDTISGVVCKYLRKAKFSKIIVLFRNNLGITVTFCLRLFNSSSVRPIISNPNIY